LVRLISNSLFIYNDSYLSNYLIKKVEIVATGKHRNLINHYSTVSPNSNKDSNRDWK